MAGQGKLPPASSPAWGAHAIPKSRNVRSIFGPLCSHREQQTGQSDPAGPEPAAKGMKEPIRLQLPLTSGRLVGATARIHLPRADLEPCSRAHPCLSEQLRGSRPWCLCLTTALMEKLVGFRGFKATVFRGVFPKDSRGCFPVTLGCDIPGAPGRDRPTPFQHCRVPLDTDSRSPKTLGGRDIKPTTVMRSEDSRLGILSRSRESFGTGFCTFTGQDVETQNPKKPKG